MCNKHKNLRKHCFVTDMSTFNIGNKYRSSEHKIKPTNQ